MYTIGFGSTDPQESVCSAEQLGSRVFEDGGFGGGGGGRGGGGRGRREIDEPTLQSVADTTGGEYFRAENAESLVDIFAELPTRVDLQTEEHEITVWFALVAAVLAVLAMGLALAWNRIS